MTPQAAMRLGPAYNVTSPLPSAVALHWHGFRYPECCAQRDSVPIPGGDCL